MLKVALLFLTSPQCSPAAPAYADGCCGGLNALVSAMAAPGATLQRLHRVAALEGKASKDSTPCQVTQNKGPSLDPSREEDGKMELRRSRA